MPTTLEWLFEGGADGSQLAARRGTQRVYFGDTVIDEVMGEGKALRIEAASIVMEMTNADGEKTEVVRTKGHVYALANREQRQARAPVRKPKGQQRLAGMLQPGKAQPAEVDAPIAKRQKGLGKPLAKAPNKTLAAQQTAAGAKELVAEAPLTLIGSQYADSDEEEAGGGNEAAPARAGKGKVTFRALDAAAKAQYRHDKYEERKEKGQDKITAGFRDTWLKKNALYGWHCALCITALVKPADKLSNKGYGWVGEGDERALVPIGERKKLEAHDKHVRHKLNVRNAQKKEAGVPRSAIDGDATIYLTITPEDELYARTIRTVHTIVVSQFSISSIDNLLQLQLANGAVISFDHASTGTSAPGEPLQGVPAWLEAGVTVFKARERDRAQNSLMRTLFPRGVPLGLQGDGSTDRALLEQEAVVTRFMGGDGRPFSSFHDLAELDLKDSYDGRSPDAPCIAQCYARSLTQLNQYEGFLFCSDWKQALIGDCFDGASVMLGSQKGAAKLLADMTVPANPVHVVTVHGVAHVQQLANLDSFGECAYYEEWRGIMQEMYVFFAGSGKKRFSLEVVANEFDATLLTMGSRHGIRWAAAEARSITAMLADLPSIATCLEVTVKAEIGMEFTLLTPSNNFLGKSFSQVFEMETGRKKTFKARVMSFNEGTVSAMDEFTLLYSDRRSLTMSKGELVSKMTNEENEALVNDSRWILRSKVMVYVFVAFTSFMSDVHEQLTILSKSFQSNSLCVFDISKNVNRTLRALNKLKESPGKVETAFNTEVGKVEGADMYKDTLQLRDGDDGRQLMKRYRIEIVESLEKNLTHRFQKVLDHPVLNAMAMFNHAKWPGTKAELCSAFTDKLELLYKTYRHFFEPDETFEMVKDQWEEMGGEILSEPSLMGLKYHDLWARTLLLSSDEYPLVLRLVVISLIVPADTSECERIFSLMNDIKTAERARMGQRNLKNLMLWHRMAKDLKAQDVPVMAILKEFRAMAGEVGRRPHRAQNPITYEYEKNRQ